MRYGDADVLGSPSPELGELDRTRSLKRLDAVVGQDWEIWHE